MKLTSQDLTDAEKNFVAYLRAVAKPFGKVTIHFDRNGMWDFFSVEVEQKVIITNEGIKEICMKNS